MKSVEPAALVTWTVPFPVRVPAPLMTTAAPGAKTALGFTLKFPLTLKFALAVTATAVLEIVRLSYVLFPATSGASAVTDCAAVPL